MKIRSMQTCIMSSLPRCIFRCSVFRYVTLVSCFFFQTCYLIVTLLLSWRINTYLLTKDYHQSLNRKEGVSYFPFDYTMCKFITDLIFYECRTNVNRLFTSEADNSFQE